MRYDGKAAFNNHGFQVHVGPMRSKSRGFVRIRSKDPRESPRILFNYLSHPDDLVEWRSCIRLTREIMAQPAMERYAGAEIQPGKDVETDEQIDAFIREHCESAYHPCGTCKMGSPQDPMAVVDAECRVIGIDEPAGRRFLHHAAGHQRQSQCAHADDRREGVRPHPRPRSAAALEPGTLDQSRLGGQPALAASCRKSSRSLRTTGPGWPPPMRRPSISTMGMTNCEALVRKASSAA